MPIPLPNLDDRRWADLVEQGRALIPLYSPEWTNHNASDPGITLMELFAWLAEMDLYRLNRIPDRHKRRLLALAGVRPMPPQPWRGAVGLVAPAGAVGPVELAESVEFSAVRLDLSHVQARSTSPVSVMPARLAAVQWRDAGGFHNATGFLGRLEPFPLFGDAAASGSELYLGFDRPLASNAWTSLYFQMDGEFGWPYAQRIRDDRGVERLPAHHSARLVWECLTGSTPPAWTPLTAEDATRSLSLDGAVRLRPNTGMAPAALGKVASPLHYVRARLVSGSWDAAPRVRRVLMNAVEVVQATPSTNTFAVARGAVVTGSAAPGARVSLRVAMAASREITAITFDAPRAPEPEFTVLAFTPPAPASPGQLILDAVFAGVGLGEPGQMVTIAGAPLIESSFRLWSLEGDRWRRWERVDDFAGSTRQSAHFLLNPESGDVVFGDGDLGRTVPAGALLFAMCETTAGPAGPLDFSGLAGSPRNRVFVTNPQAWAVTVSAGVSSFPGEHGESLHHAIGRAIRLREAPLRAVTAADCEAIALAAPGTRIARAFVRPNLYPGLDCIRAAGMTTVLIVPDAPGPQPVPSAGLLAEVARQLNARRIVGSRFEVAGPRYVEVAVRARVRAFPGADRSRLKTQLAEALDGFLHPLRGGPARSGWPFGRDVYRSEILQVLDGVPGVDHVLSLELQAEGCGPSCGNVCLGPGSLVAAGPHEIEVI